MSDHLTDIQSHDEPSEQRTDSKTLNLSLSALSSALSCTTTAPGSHLSLCASIVHSIQVKLSANLFDQKSGSSALSKQDMSAEIITEEMILRSVYTHLSIFRQRFISYIFKAFFCITKHIWLKPMIRKESKQGGTWSSLIGCWDVGVALKGVCRWARAAGAELKRLNDWRNPAYITREKIC